MANRIEDIRANNPSLLEGARNINDIKVRAEEVDLFASVADRVYNDEVRRYAKFFWVCEGHDHYSIAWQGDFQRETLDLRQNLSEH